MQFIVVKFMNRIDGSMLEVRQQIPEIGGRFFRKGDFRYKRHEVVNG